MDRRLIVARVCVWEGGEGQHSLVWYLGILKVGGEGGGGMWLTSDTGQKTECYQDISLQQSSMLLFPNNLKNLKF